MDNPWTEHVKKYIQACKDDKSNPKCISWKEALKLSSESYQELKKIKRIDHNNSKKDVGRRVKSFEINNKKQLDDILSQRRNPLVVMFGASWCGFCKDLRSKHYSKMIDENLPARNNENVLFYDVEAGEASSGIAEQYNVIGFPTIRYYPRNKKSPFVDFGQNERNEIGIRAWASDLSSH